ncbi:MAG: hypothetical protein ACLR01_00055 [Vescimonas sp.]
MEPQLLLGDFDSLAEVPALPHVERVPVEKDDTDMMLAVKRGLERGETLFHLYGGMGGQRTDHTVANFQALLYLADHGARGWLHGRGERWTAIRDGSIVFPARPEGILSVFCVGPDAEGVTIRGRSTRWRGDLDGLGAAGCKQSLYWARYYGRGDTRQFAAGVT